MWQWHQDQGFVPAKPDDRGKSGVMYAATVLISRRDYNLVRLHKTLRVTPAMAAGVTDRAT